MNVLEQFKKYVKRIDEYNHAIMLMHWDMETQMPPKGAEAHIAALTTLSGEVFEMSISDEMENYLEALTQETLFETLSDLDKIMVTKLKEDFEENKNIPPSVQKRLVEIQARSQNAWQEAKHKNDFERMIPYFEEMIELSKEIAYYIDPTKPAYDVWLGQYEKGLDSNKIEKLFKQLKDESMPLIHKICEKESFDETPFYGSFEDYKQRELGLYLLKEIGFDLEAGRLDESEHPFTTGTAPFDVRVTTNYDSKDLRPSIFSIIHEGGHGIYEQNIDPKLVGTGLNSGTSMGIHESQSRFYENIVGRSLAFWKKHYHKVQDEFDGFKSMDLETFYRGQNKVESSLIRIDADELTYNLHIIIRFELEKALFDGTLKVKDLPKAWNEKMKQYLGIEPKNDTEGVLQDVHWPSGMFGYFPSYALGNIYSGQFLAQLEKELGSLETLIEEDRLGEVTQWLNEKIHQFGRMKTPTEIIQDVCGTEVDATPILQYYKRKYSKIYGL